ncbi:MAG: hypothetical protein IPL42_12220 [Saprospiraceae bacterium]|nr:hypothetical protein [Saprospiraceae bacterium]
MGNNFSYSIFLSLRHLDVFSKLWDSAWGVKLEHILRHAILTLLDQPEATIADIVEILLNKDFRREALRYVKSESVKNSGNENSQNI